jgi:hypothetical protein
MLIIFINLIASLNKGYAASSTVYAWKNEQGILVFSDSPKPGAEEITINTPTNISSSADTTIANISPQAIDSNYQIEITQPINKATLRDNTGSVYIAGRVKPIFNNGFRVQLYLDNNPHGSPQAHSMFVLKNIDRGEHSLKMELLDEKGKVIALSNSTTFYMHRASAIRAN